MKRLLPFIVLLFTVTAFGQVSQLNSIKNPSLGELRKNFASPHRDYSTGPLWTWNDRLTEEQVRSTLRDLAGQRVRQVWIHPRPGLMVPYLSEEWFRLWKAALDEAEKLDVNVWIYDENSYPSGFAGGFVPEALPDSRGMGLKFEEVGGSDFLGLDSIPEDVWYIFVPAPDSPTGFSLCNKEPNGSLPPLENNQKYLLGKVQPVPPAGWFAGKWYVDILKKGVTEKFIEITHEAYKKNVGDQFGKRVPGIFTDEPFPPGVLVGTWVTWNNEIPELFERKFGYSLIENLPSLHKPVGDWKKVRHNYHALILELFIEHWAKPTFEWCEKNNLEWTGHYCEHVWPDTAHGPDHMAMYPWSHRPSIDLLMNTYDDTLPDAQFGNVRIVKELASIANQMGRSRTLSENYGAGGWDLRFEDMKRLGDWSYALGVNTSNEHLSYVTIRGARKRDHPQSFSYHASWFEGYHTMADYFTRLSYMLSQGRQINRIVVLEPTTTVWMYAGEPKQKEIGQSFTEFVNALEHAQVEYDLASEDTIARFGKVNDKLSTLVYFNLSREVRALSIGDAEYYFVIIPPNMENINGTTLKLLAEYVERGGAVIYFDALPSRVDGAEPNEDAVRNLEMLGKSSKLEVSHMQGLCDSYNNEYMQIRGISNDGRSSDSNDFRRNRYLFSHRRQLNGYEIVFVCNTSRDETLRVWTVVSLRGDDHLCVEEWDLFSGGKKVLAPEPPAPSAIIFSGFTSRFYQFILPPSGSRLFVISRGGDKIDDGQQEYPATTVLPGTDTSIKRLEENVLTLDYVDVKIGDEERKDVYTWQANRWIYQQNGFDAGNPWDNQVQFKDELITRKFPEGSGFEAVYKFVIAETATDLAIVIERADLYTVYCNDVEVKPQPNAWWLDRSFGKIDISKFVKPGENTVKIVAGPMTIEHELEPAYLLGDFSLRSADKGFVVCPPQSVELEKPWNEQGMPFYAGKVEYARNFEIAQVEGTYSVQLPNSVSGWYGTTARAIVNGNDAGFIVSAPWAVDVTKFIKQGTNEIAVQVYGTPKNLLGPHHAGKLRGSAWPGSFHQAPEHQPPGAAYDVIGCGLFEPFALISVVP